MGILTEAFRPLALRLANLPAQTFTGSQPAAMPGNYVGYSREGYGGNSVVYACIEALSTSAAEPGMRARYGQRWTTEHAVLRLLNRPNPFMDHFEFWATVILHRSLAGNAYALKVRTNGGRVDQLWLMRPDRVSIIPHPTEFIARYEYDVGGGPKVRIPVNDVIHWKTRNPLSEFYGMPSLQAIAGYIDVDNFMRDFQKAYFANAGVPGGVMTFKQKLNDEQKRSLRDRFRGTYGGSQGWHELLVVDNGEMTYTPLTQAMGTTGLVVPELNQVSESRIAMAFGVPLSLVGTLAGAGNSSYGNKKSERENFWNETLKPLYQELSGPLNIGLVPEFPGVDEVGFDLSSVGALGGDTDLLHARVRADFSAGLLGEAEARELLGYGPLPSSDTFLLPSNMAPTAVADLKNVPPPVAPVVAAPTNGVTANGNGKTPVASGA